MGNICNGLRHTISKFAAVHGFWCVAWPRALFVVEFFVSFDARAYVISCHKFNDAIKWIHESSTFLFSDIKSSFYDSHLQLFHTIFDLMIFKRCNQIRAIIVRIEVADVWKYTPKIHVSIGLHPKRFQYFTWTILIFSQEFFFLFKRKRNWIVCWAPQLRNHNVEEEEKKSLSPRALNGIKNF